MTSILISKLILLPGIKSSYYFYILSVYQIIEYDNTRFWKYVEYYDLW